MEDTLYYHFTFPCFFNTSNRAYTSSWLSLPTEICFVVRSNFPSTFFLIFSQLGARSAYFRIISSSSLVQCLRLIDRFISGASSGEGSGEDSEDSGDGTGDDSGDDSCDDSGDGFSTPHRHPTATPFSACDDFDAAVSLDDCGCSCRRSFSVSSSSSSDDEASKSNAGLEDGDGTRFASIQSSGSSRLFCTRFSSRRAVCVAEMTFLGMRRGDGSHFTTAGVPMTAV